jgi:anti-sigma28 factor (negative regulator of flagellin synthesis)
MKIDATNAVYRIGQYYTTVNRNNTVNFGGQEGDDIEISEEAVSFAEIFSVAKAAFEKQDYGTPDVKLEEIRNQVADGTYMVQEQTLADSILMYI